MLPHSLFSAISSSIKSTYFHAHRWMDVSWILKCCAEVFVGFFFAMNVWLVVNQQGKKKRITNATMMLTSFLIHLLLLSSILCCSCLAAKLCPIFYDPMDYSPPGSPGTSWSSVHGISQARILNTAISFSRETSWPRDRTHVSCTARQTLLPLSRQGGMSIWVMSSLEQWKL